MHYPRLGLQTLLATPLLRAIRADAGECFCRRQTILALNDDFSRSVAAGVNACLWLDKAPPEPYEVAFKAGSDQDHYMYNTGQDATVNVSQSGVTCVSVGYVGGKSSSSGGDTC